MLDKVLTVLGFSQDEVRTYSVLLEIGPIPAGKLARKLGVVRSSLYGYLKRLEEKGLVTESQKRGVKTFLAEQPEKLNLLFRQRMEELERGQGQFRGLLPQLRNAKVAKFINPRFQLYEGEEGVRSALKDILLYNDMETQAFWPQKKMVDILSPDFFRYHNKERIKNNLYTRAIWPKNQIVQIKDHPYFGVGPKFKREIRIAPESVDFSMGYWIYGTKVAFISSRKESFGFIIESAELVEMLLVQFEVVWGLSEPLIVDPKDTELFLREIEEYGSR